MLPYVLDGFLGMLHLEFRPDAMETEPLREDEIRKQFHLIEREISNYMSEYEVLLFLLPFPYEQ